MRHVKKQQKVEAVPLVRPAFRPYRYSKEMKVRVLITV